jgi:protein transport protein SEC31
MYVWDLKNPGKPYAPTPGTCSAKLDEITLVAWNNQAQYILACASSSGYTIVWDLRGKREVIALAYGGGCGAMGTRRGMSGIAWHPDNVP